MVSRSRQISGPRLYSFITFARWAPDRGNSRQVTGAPIRLKSSSAVRHTAARGTVLSPGSEIVSERRRFKKKKKRTVTQSDALPLDAGLRMNGRMFTSTHYAAEFSSRVTSD